MNITQNIRTLTRRSVGLTALALTAVPFGATLVGTATASAAPAAHAAVVGATSAVSLRLPEGTLLKSTTSDKIYVIEKGLKRWITSPAVFNYRGYNWGAVLILDQWVVDLVPTGAAIYMGAGGPVRY